MKRLKHCWATALFGIAWLLLVSNPAIADDTCIFAVTADDVPPNIVLLLDNGAEMEQITWHAGYDNSVDYTPVSGSVFTNANGYGVDQHGSTHYLVPILDDLTLGSYTHASSIPAGSGTAWTINGRTVTLPVFPSTAVDGNGIKDNAAHFRYSTNYLNWIFYSVLYTGDGSDLPSKSRFYYAKKAIFTVARLAENKAKFGIYNFTSTTEGSSRVQPLGMVVNTPLAANPEDNILDSNFVNNINNMGTVTYSPLAEGLAYIGGQYDSESLHVVGEYCQRSFALIISPGVSSQDQTGASQYVPTSLSDYDGDNAAGGIGEGNIKADQTIYAIPTNLNGSTYLG